MTKMFRAYTLDQQLLLPPDMRQWLPEGDLALFMSDVVDELDLSAIYHSYETGDGRGQPPYDPAMMVKVLLYAYCMGLRSSRKIERATYRDVAIRVLAGDQHPDHDSIAEFRRRHLPALAGLFVQGLRLCQAAVLEQQARDEAARAAEEGRAKVAAREQRAGSAKGGVPKVPDPRPGAAGTWSAVQLHRPGLAHHARRGEQELGAGLQRAGGGGC